MYTCICIRIYIYIRIHRINIQCVRSCKTPPMTPTALRKKTQEPMLLATGISS